MDMKQTSNCSGFNVTFRPSAFFRRGTYLQVKRLKRCKDVIGFTELQVFIPNIKM